MKDRVKRGEPYLHWTNCRIVRRQICIWKVEVELADVEVKLSELFEYLKYLFSSMPAAQDSYLRNTGEAEDGTGACSCLISCSTEGVIDCFRSAVLLPENILGSHL